MSSNPIRLQKLFEKYIYNTCTKQELREFWQLLSELSENDTLSEQLETLWQQRDENYNPAAGASKEKIFERIREKAREREIDYDNLHRRPAWPGRLLAAAVFIGVLVIGYHLFFHKINQVPLPAASGNEVMKNDASPGISKAVLTLASGKRIVLDSATTGAIGSQGNTTIINLNGQLAYNANAYASSGESGEVAYNTLSTARGNQYQLILSDGSKIWLNAASSIRYPAVFTGKERKVEIRGEAYLEVKHNEKMPFRVKVGDGVIEDLGTHFNINAYDDESTVRITLLEGSVKITENTAASTQWQAVTLLPGQQAQVNKEGQIRVLKNVDTEEAVAWKNGYFEFNKADLPGVMRQLSRWYDVDVSYEGKVPQQQFGGAIQRDLNLSQVLELLEKSGVHFRIEAGKLIVTP